jgi:hypothetical protein
MLYLIKIVYQMLMLFIQLELCHEMAGIFWHDNNINIPIFLLTAAAHKFLMLNSGYENL